MASQSDLDGTYMNFALGLSKLSKAKRKQVGAVLVTKNDCVLTGINGTPRGWDNTCEDTNNNTLPSVVHAELQCTLKAAREGVSVIGSTCYVTLAPCASCSAMLAQAGVKRVVYLEDYRDMTGVESLKKNNIEVQKLEMDGENI